MIKNDTIITIIDKIKKDKIFVYSSHASFYILISAIPFITLSFSIINFLFSVNENNIYDILLPFLPKPVQSAAENIFKEIFTKTSKNYISFSLITLLWTASRGISAIKRGLRQIYNLKNQSFIKDAVLSILQMFFMMSAIIIFLSFTLLPSFIPQKDLVFLLGFITFVFIFLVIYYLLTGRDLPLKLHIPGSISASFSWVIFIRIFSIYIEHFSNYSYLYGNLTAVFLIALWIYFSIIIFFLGAELNALMLSGIFKNKKRTVM